MQRLLVNSATGLIETFYHGPVDAERWEIAMDRAWALIEPIGNRIVLFLAVDRAARAFRQALPQQLIRIIAAPPLPRAMGIAAVNLDRNSPETTMTGACARPGCRSA